MRLSRLLALAAATPLLAAAARAQTSVGAATPLLNEPSGRELAELRAGARVTAGAVNGAFTSVVLRGYIDSSLVGGKRDTFAASVRAPSGAMLRSAASPTAAPLAVLRDGMGLVVVSRSGR
jgi:hypothetical protein